MNTCTCDHTESCYVVDQLTDAKTEIERLHPCHQFALRLPPGRSFNEFDGNISGRLYAMKREHDEAVSQLSDAKTEIEQLKATHINQADVINRQYDRLTAINLEITRINGVAEKELNKVSAKMERLDEAVKSAVEENTAAKLEIDRVNRIAEEELDEVNGKVEKLRKAFIKLAVHNETCKSHQWYDLESETMLPCDCGYDQALADTEDNKMTNKEAEIETKKLFGEDSFTECDDNPQQSRRYYVGACPKIPGVYLGFMGFSWEEALNYAALADMEEERR